jgi:hypothetical protein
MIIYEKFRNFIKKKDEETKNNDAGDGEMNDPQVSCFGNFAVYLQSGYK